MKAKYHTGKYVQQLRAGVNNPIFLYLLVIPGSELAEFDLIVFQNFSS